MIINIKRDLKQKHPKKQTSGICTIYDDNTSLFTCLSLERGWLNNEPNISCVPKGVYDCVFEYSPKFKRYLWELKNVPNRTECKFHVANYSSQLNGCIGLGYQRLDINNDKELDVTRSSKTIEIFHEVLRPCEDKTIKVIYLI